MVRQIQFGQNTTSAILAMIQLSRQQEESAQARHDRTMQFAIMNRKMEQEGKQFAMQQENAAIEQMRSVMEEDEFKKWFREFKGLPGEPEKEEFKGIIPSIPGIAQKGAEFVFGKDLAQKLPLMSPLGATIALMKGRQKKARPGELPIQREVIGEESADVPGFIEELPGGAGFESERDKLLFGIMNALKPLGLSRDETLDILESEDPMEAARAAGANL